MSEKDVATEVNGADLRKLWDSIPMYPQIDIDPSFPALLSQAKRRSKPRTQVEITVFGPDDRRALIMRMGK